MDPSTLPDMPAPFWFVQFFKVVGFVLHMIPMGIWFAGLPVAIGCAIWNCRHSRRFARRLFGQLPIFMALGINFGIVPLLFLQTTYYKSFYTATILMGWHWLAVIPILIVGYYSLYIAAFSARPQIDEKRPKRMILFGVVASVCLIAIGILITNGLTLMVCSDLWPGIMERTNYYGATTGLANNMRDPAVWIRLATMFSLGLMTTGVWAAFDSHFLLKTIEPGPSGPGRSTPEQNVDSAAMRPETNVPGSMDELNEYRRWLLHFAFTVSSTGFLCLVGVALTRMGVDGKDIEMAYPKPTISFVVFLASFVVCLLFFAWRKNGSVFLPAAVLMQIATLATFGIIRQIGQNAGVANYVDVSKIPTDVQWTPLISFLVLFALGLLIIAWMVRQLVLCEKQDSTPSAAKTQASPNS